MHVRHHTHLLGLLVAVLVFSAAMPCGLLELEEDLRCTTQASDPNPSGGEEAAGGFDTDCCAGCLTCCASSLEAGVFPVASLALPVLSLPLSLDLGPRGSEISIWRPPRA